MGIFVQLTFQNTKNTERINYEDNSKHQSFKKLREALRREYTLQVQPINSCSDLMTKSSESFCEDPVSHNQCGVNLQTHHHRVRSKDSKKYKKEKFFTAHFYPCFIELII